MQCEYVDCVWVHLKQLCPPRGKNWGDLGFWTYLSMKFLLSLPLFNCNINFKLRGPHLGRKWYQLKCCVCIPVQPSVHIIGPLAPFSYNTQHDKWPRAVWIDWLCNNAIGLKTVWDRAWVSIGMGINGHGYAIEYWMHPQRPTLPWPFSFGSKSTSCRMRPSTFFNLSKN